MALDMNALRRKLAQLSGKNKKTSSMWRPKEGEESLVRILSFKDNDGQPFKELYFYYNIGNNPGLLAPYQHGKADPIQELITELRKEASKESYELAKKLYPKMRVYAPVIVRGEEDKGVQIWGFGKLVYQSLLNIMLDEDYGDITDPTEGRDVKVICTKPPGRKWATTEVRPRGKQTPLSSNSTQSKNWQENIPDIDSMFECKSYEELQKIVNDWINGSVDEDDTGTEWNTNKSKQTSSAEPSQKNKAYSSLDSAFADLEDI